MYFEDLKIGMTVETAPAVIEKEKMMAFAVRIIAESLWQSRSRAFAQKAPRGAFVGKGACAAERKKIE